MTGRGAPKAGPLRWKVAGWLSARIPSHRGKDRLLTLVRGPKAPTGPLRGQLSNGFRFEFDECDDGVVTELIGLQYGAPALAGVVDWFSKPGAVVYDIGANIGIYTLRAAAGVGPEGQVHAFEPVPSTATMLRRLIALNGLQNVLVVDQAIARTSGVASIHVIQDASGLASMSARPGSRGIPVSTTTLDDYAEAHDPPSFIKVDVEGHEADVLAGADRLLNTTRPSLLLEVIGATQAEGGGQMMIRSLRRLGYEVFDLAPRGLSVSGWPTTTNVLALHSERLDHRESLKALGKMRFPLNQTT